MCASCIIEGYTAAQSQISRTFGWPTLESRRNYLKFMLVLMSLHGLAPPYLLNEFSQSPDFRSYNKRHRDLLRLLLARTTKYKGSFRFSGAKIWNTLPLDLRREYDINKFAFGLKRHFRSKPNWASLTFFILSCTIFYLYWFVPCVVFSFSSEQPQSSLAELAGHPWLNTVWNKIIN